MFVFKKYRWLLYPASILLLFCCKSQAFAGEPIPGAEIYVELEPEDNRLNSGGRGVIVGKDGQAYRKSSNQSVGSKDKLTKSGPDNQNSQFDTKKRDVKQ